jgi:hypothetical protein
MGDRAAEVVLAWQPGKSYEQVVAEVLRPSVLFMGVWILPATLLAYSFAIEGLGLRVLAWLGVVGLVALFAYAIARRLSSEEYREADARYREFLDDSQLRGAYGCLQVAFEALKWARSRPQLDAQGHAVKGEDGKPLTVMDYPSVAFVTSSPSTEVRIRIDTRGGIAPQSAIIAKSKDIQSFLGYNDWTATNEIPMSSHVDIVLSRNRVGGIFG